MEQEPKNEFPTPGEIAFYDQEYSYKVFCLLEANADGFGGWQVMDTLNIAWIDLPEQLQADLMTWRWLNDIGERIKANRETEKK